jgi:hypothetical protein
MRTTSAKTQRGSRIESCCASRLNKKQRTDSVVMAIRCGSFAFEDRYSHAVDAVHFVTMEFLLWLDTIAENSFVAL